MNLGTCSSRIAKELLCPGQRFPDANIFQRLEQSPWYRNEILTVHVNAGREWSVRTPSNEDSTIVGVELELW
jgi:hypothetical protein